VQAGLGALAAAAGTLLSSRLRSFKVQPEPRRRLYVLSAMCSVFGALMPSPLVAILLVVELARPFGLLSLHYMHIIAILACGTTASFAVYFGIAG
jgi:H+/Cl- antiporter ClcA